MERMRARGDQPLLLSELCGESEEPVFGLVGAPLGLKLVGLSYGFDQQGRCVKVGLEYKSAAGLVVEVKSGDEEGRTMSARAAGQAPDPSEADRQRRRLEAAMAAGTAFTKLAHELALVREAKRFEDRSRQVDSWTFEVPPVSVAVIETKEGRCVVSGSLAEADFRRVLNAVRRIDDQPEELRRQDEELRERYRSLGRQGPVVPPTDDANHGPAGHEDTLPN
jgi:hypothetical protein